LKTNLFPCERAGVLEKKPGTDLGGAESTGSTCFGSSFGLKTKRGWSDFCELSGMLGGWNSAGGSVFKTGGAGGNVGRISCGRAAGGIIGDGCIDVGGIIGAEEGGIIGAEDGAIIGAEDGGAIGDIIDAAVGGIMGLAAIIGAAK